MKAFFSPRAVASLLGLILCALLLPACTGENAPVDNTAMLPENERVSSVPWNKPQGWENNSQLGTLANNPRIGGGNGQQ